MSEHSASDGSTDITDEQRKRTESLGDGTPDGHSADSDTTSGGPAEEPDTTDPDGTPVENPSG